MSIFFIELLYMNNEDSIFFNFWSRECWFIFQLGAKLIKRKLRYEWTRINKLGLISQAVKCFDMGKCFWDMIWLWKVCESGIWRKMIPQFLMDSVCAGTYWLCYRFLERIIESPRFWGSRLRDRRFNVWRCPVSYVRCLEISRFEK